ncbi:MAG: bifunctional diaminohydroxyphosphoribosylaminopyrimidine deaminase/5-amino-6-(5-phosphoribosylamino)uracil reductase RibD [Pirellulales bacterium]
MFSSTDTKLMHRACKLARRGEGFVEPNPMVGAVVADSDGTVLGEGWHKCFGSAHAEVHALAMAGEAARGATLFVTLEPCCHTGKTPPCTDAILSAGIRRVVVAATDPFAAVAGKSISLLQKAGLQVDVGLLQQEATRLTAPFRMLTMSKRPWMIAKWAMTIDGYLALPRPSVDGSGESHKNQWISSGVSRAIVHDLRRRVDAIVVGVKTALTDDPLLTARPSGARPLVRVVLDRQARLPVNSRLVQTSHEHPVLVAVGPQAAKDQVEKLQDNGCEIWHSSTDQSSQMLLELAREFGSRQMTNVLVEGGAQVLESYFQADIIDEVWAFLAPKLLDAHAPSLRLREVLSSITIEAIDQTGGDLFVRGLRQHHSLGR